MGTGEDSKSDAVQDDAAASDERIPNTMPEITVTPEVHDSQESQHKLPAPLPERRGPSAPNSHQGKEDAVSTVSDSERRHRAKQRNAKKARNKELEDSTDDSTSEDDVKPEKSKSHRKSRKGLTKHAKKKQIKRDNALSSSSDEGTLTKEQSLLVSKKLADIKTEAKTQLSKLVDSLNIDSINCGDTSTDTAAQCEKLSLPASKPTAGEPLAHLTCNASFVKQALTMMTAQTTNEASDDEKSETTTKDASTSTEKVEKGSKAEFMRLDRVWDDNARRYKSKPSSKEQDVDKYSGSAFNAVRHFNYKGEYRHTQLNIISTALKKVMMGVMGQVQGISLEEDPAKLNPDDVFLYLEELRACSKKLKAEIKATNRKSKIEQLKTGRSHLKVLIKYLDEDYAEIKKSLYPLLASRKITFDLVWALFKSNEIVYTSTYEVQEQPRAVKVKFVSQETSILDGKFYQIETEYFDYDGQQFGMAKAVHEIKKFHGAIKISSLKLYPLKYHDEPEKMTAMLIERGKKFVELAGMQYKYVKGMAFHKREKKVIKVNVDGRVMIDPATFRRMRPNYEFSYIKPPEKDLIDYVSESDASESDMNESTDSSSDDASQSGSDKPVSAKKQRRIYRKEKKNWKQKAYLDSEDSDGDGKVKFALVYRDPTDDVEPEKLEPLEPTNPADNDNTPHNDKDQPSAAAAAAAATTSQAPNNNPLITATHHLLASPVALGFAFPDKLWLEFTVSSIHPIAFNSSAFDSLIIPPDQKRVVKALVESHSRTAPKNIDDVIQGKGRGLVAVLHGPPGTGKTLTAEGIAEFLQKPLYSVSVGELGIKGGDVERSLTQILDMAHTWGALLLLDEADVFLEQRTATDVERNALVSIFLRMLEYFQGILFLTTNRVEVFDPAFASRIHIGLRYGALDLPARKAVWRLFIQKVRDLKDQGVEVEEFGEEEMKRLAGFELNGREIKNAVRTAQSVALIGGEKLGMRHFLQVLLVGEVFAKDLKGWGQEEMMKFYM